MTAATAGRRRWPWALLIGVLVVVALLIAAEFVARAVVPQIVRSQVVDGLHLPADQQLDVQTTGVLLPQLISGRLDELQLSSRRVALGGITGAVHVVATGVPLHGGALDSANGTVTFDQAQFAALLKDSQLPITDVVLKGPDVTVHGEVPVLGNSIPVGLTVTPGAQDGDLLLTPVSAALGGVQVDLKRLAGLLGGLGSQLAGPQRICIADRLPAGIALTGLRIEGAEAVADITADGRIATEPALLRNGTCPR